MVCVYSFQGSLQNHYDCCVLTLITQVALVIFHFQMATAVEMPYYVSSVNRKGIKAAPALGIN